MTAHPATPTAPDSRFLRAAALTGGLGALIFVLTSLTVAAGLISDTPSVTGHILDLLVDLMLIIGLAGFVRSRAATGWLARIGLTAAFAGLGVYTLASVLAFPDPGAGEYLHPLSVPLTGLGMLLAGIATLRARSWQGWQRYAPLVCGMVPFGVELPGFIVLGDSPTLNYVIACTWTSWLALNIALWTRSVAAYNAGHHNSDDSPLKVRMPRGRSLRRG